DEQVDAVRRRRQRALGRIADVHGRVLRVGVRERVGLDGVVQTARGGRVAVDGEVLDRGRRDLLAGRVARRGARAGVHAARVADPDLDGAGGAGGERGGQLDLEVEIGV